MMRKFTLGVVTLVGLCGPAFAQNVAKGAQVFEVCRTCHQIGPNAVNMLGPPLNGIDGRRAGTVPGYEYSDAMVAAGKTGTAASKGPVIWNEATFSQYIADPQAMIPNIKMFFAGISGKDKDQKIKDLWAYISQFNADGSIKKK
jgi:cytochrome c